jgi:hypothetical protein
MSPAAEDELCPRKCSESNALGWAHCDRLPGVTAPGRGGPRAAPDHWHDDDADSSGLGASGSSSTPSRKNGGSKPEEGCHARAMQPRPTKPGLMGVGPGPSLSLPVGLQWSRWAVQLSPGDPSGFGAGWPLTCHGRATRLQLSDLTDLRLLARTKAPVANFKVEGHCPK